MSWSSALAAFSDQVSGKVGGKVSGKVGRVKGTGRRNYLGIDYAA